MTWIEKLIKRSYNVVAFNDAEEILVDELISKAIELGKSGRSLGATIAAFYDLAVSSVYYTNITNSGWLYCHLHGPKLILPFVNCCPEHVLNGDFVFHKSSKPTSAKIGQATTRILLLFYSKLFEKYNKNMRVLKAAEPADAIFYDESTKHVFLGEIKSSPLLTMSLSMSCEEQTCYDDNGNINVIEHQPMFNSRIIGSELSILLPRYANRKWTNKEYPIGRKTDKNDELFAYVGIKRLIEDDNFISDYLTYWDESFRAYCEKDDSQNIFWLTNACGKPSTLPDDWTGGVTCISDEKTSVGMDRTDDIKKGIYQVLKLGAEGKTENANWYCKVGILSNIHPVRHFNIYLKPIKDLVWTIVEKQDIRFAKDLDPNTAVYNLFDGIITFTDNYIRDKWLNDCLDMLTK